MISDRIKEIRQKCGLSQADFGKRLGVSRDVVSNIENERLKNPGQKESLYRLICATFGVDEHWLPSRWTTWCNSRPHIHI